jgi:hypothetical protein
MSGGDAAEEKLIEHVIAARAELGVKTNAELLILLESDFKGLTMSEVKKAASKATKRAGGACVPAAAEPSPAENAPSKRQEKAQEKAKGAALPEHAAASPGLAIISGRAPYFQKAWWFDEAVPKTTGTLARFKAAFVRDAPALGLSSEQIAQEQILFDVPFFFDLSGDDRQDLTTATSFLSNAMRLGISSLSVARLKVIIDCADALNALGNRVVDPGAVADALSPMGFPIRSEDILILTVALNLPAVCDAYVYSAPADKVIAWRCTLGLDVAKLNVAMRTIVMKPTATQKVVSRQVCFFCGASPLAASVCLTDCPRCGCVAYCSEEHRKIDHLIAHQLECGCKKGFVSAGVPVTPCRELSISRIATEISKEFSAMIPSRRRRRAESQSCVTVARPKACTGHARCRWGGTSVPFEEPEISRLKTGREVWFRCKSLVSLLFNSCSRLRISLR